MKIVSHKANYPLACTTCGKNIPPHYACWTDVDGAGLYYCSAECTTGTRDDTASERSTFFAQSDAVARAGEDLLEFKGARETLSDLNNADAVALELDKPRLGGPDRDVTRAPHYTAADAAATAATAKALQARQPQDRRQRHLDRDVHHPAHYNQGGIEVIDAIEAWGLGFSDGNAVKYIARAGHKLYPGADARESRRKDLEKAKFYLEREIENCKEPAE